MHQFHFELPKDDVRPTLDCEKSAVRFPKPYNVIATKRPNAFSKDELDEED